jgi:hypothetical protein
VQEVNVKGWGLYAEFRPDVEGWGGRGEVTCRKILELRKKGGTIQDSKEETTDGVVKFEVVDEAGIKGTRSEDGPETKKARGMTLEEYEAALDQDSTFDGIDI